MKNALIPYKKDLSVGNPARRPKMSIGIDSVGSSGSILSGLQNMQRQMRALSAAAGNNGQSVAQPHVYDSALSEEDKSVNTVSGAVPSVNGKESAANRVGAFEHALKEAFENVNNLQNNASNLQTRFDTGDRQVTLSDVMLATQKSSISFEAAVQIRNKLIEAYKTVSQMQI